MVADWSLNTEVEGDNGDLFVVDLFTDELYEIYNAPEGANGTSGSSGKRSL